jgi:hypothetical protein
MCGVVISRMRDAREKVLPSECPLFRNVTESQSDRPTWKKKTWTGQKLAQHITFLDWESDNNTFISYKNISFAFFWQNALRSTVLSG